MLHFPAMIALLAAVSGPAAAQTTLRPGQTVQGELTTSDPTLGDGSHYDCFVLPTRQGQRLQIDQTSEAFDSYLTIGLGTCEAPSDPESDDDGGGGLNSRLVHVAQGGALTIRVNSLAAAETGAYRLSVSEMSGGTPTQGNRPSTATAPAPATAEGPATLAQASCQRLGEVLVAFHEFRAGNSETSVSLGQQGNPEIARLQPRVDRVAAWLSANGHSPNGATRADGALYRTGTPEQLTEFERRCAR